MAGKSLTLAAALAIAISLGPGIPTVSVGVGPSQTAVAAPASRRAGSDSDTNNTPDTEGGSSRQIDIQKKLDEPTEFHVKKMPLIEVLGAVEKLSGLTITVELSELALRGVDPQTPMTLDLKDVTLRSLIAQLTRQAHLTFGVEAGGIRIPATTPPLEFRLVPDAETVEAAAGALEDLEESDYRDGTIPKSDPADARKYAWFPIRRKEVPDVELPVSLNVGEFRIGLLSDSAHHVLTADRSWHVLSVDIQNDKFEIYNIRVKLDKLGGLHMQRLSKLCLDRKMAMIVNGVIITVPIVRGEIGSEFVITGNFSNDEVTRIADGIRGAIVPEGKELVYECDVTDEETGKPIAGVDVLWRVRKTSFKLDETPLFEQRFTTDSNGRYRVTLPREAFEFAQRTTEFEALHPDYLPKKRVGTRLTLPDAVPPGWSDLRHLKLRRGVPVTGRFIEPDGRPAANLVLMVSVNRDGPGQGYPGDVIGRTDENGRYRVVTSPGWPKRLHWFPENFVSDSVKLMKRTDSPDSITFGDQGTIRLKHGPRLSGRVLDQSGKPLEGVILRASTGTRVPIRYATSNTKGQFTFTPLPPARYRVSTADGFFDPFIEEYRSQRLARPFSEVTFELPESGTPEPITIQQVESDVVTVMAFDENDEPTENETFWTGTRTNRTAISEAAPDEPGKYRLWVRRDRSAGAITTHGSQTSVILWQRTAESPLAPGAFLSLGKVSGDNDEVIVRFRHSGEIRLVVKVGDRIVPWDARSLSVSYARSAEFAELGVPDPGFIITVPKQGPEHVIQRVAPDEDVIIDVGINGERRQQRTVRVGAGETKTVTIDFVETLNENP
ncbi:MAG: carboxypeptidase regulatory-like domain-containing protein [Planctomycetota bacterium]|nr:carboxypeptidase regulatory-like domain-containing protein [Planctomycetota bacterium]